MKSSRDYRSVDLLNAIIHRAVSENFPNGKPHVHVETLIFSFSDQKLQRKRAVWIATGTSFKDNNVAHFERVGDVIRKSQVGQRASLIGGKREWENLAMIELCDFLDVVHQLKSEY